MTFGLGQAESFVYPALEIVRIIDINFIDRLDIYALILMTFGSFIRCSLFLKISFGQLKHLVANNSKQWLNITLFIILSILIGISAYFMGETRLRFESTLIVYAYTIVLYPLPFLLLLVAWIRKRRVFTKQA